MNPVQKSENYMLKSLMYDSSDELAAYRNEFHFPVNDTGKTLLYFCGNSLGLQPKSTESYVLQELEDWRKYGVEGHMQARKPWLPYHEFLTQSMANLVGAKSHEVIVMNTLSVNLHLMMVSFYKPTTSKYKILIEKDAFPSDRYAVASQIRFHGYDPLDALIELKPRQNEYCLRSEDIESTIKNHKDEIALILIGNTNYYTGQFFDMKSLVKWGHDAGGMIGFDCAHGAGNVPLDLHENDADFAVWCSYKYLNSGPGSLGGVFINEKHLKNKNIDRFEGWWGHNKSTRFGMRDEFDPIPTAEAWQLSNPPILSMAAIRASLEVFERAGIHNLRKKSIKLTGFLEEMINDLDYENIEIITPVNPDERGSQLSIRIKNADKSLHEKLLNEGIITDWREPDVIRVTPAPLYNSFHDVYLFVQSLKKILNT